MPRITKQEFVEKYHYSPSKYHRRMKELKKTAIFKRAYIRVTTQEIWIDTDLFDQFLEYQAFNRLRARKVTPEDYLQKYAIQAILNTPSE